MATAKKKTTPVHTIQEHHKSDVRVHLLMGSAIGLLLFISAAQFILSQAIWNKVDVDQPAPPVADSELAGKLTVTSVTTKWFTAQLPSSFYMQESQNPDAYTIGNQVAHAYIYQTADQAKVDALIQQTGGDFSLNSTEYITAVGGATYTVQYWYDTSTSPQDERIVQLHSVIDSLFPGNPEV